MAKKLTYEFVKEQFEKEGYTLLSTDYKNSKEKLNYRCPEGHLHSIRWNDWKTGYRCSSCAGVVKYTLEDVRTIFQKEGCTLLSENYIDNRQKLDYICSNGHNHNICLHDWLGGHRCIYCAGLNKPSIDDIRSAFSSEGYVLLSTEYKNSSTKLKYICPNGHKESIKWNSWQQGRRCPSCAGNKKLTINYIHAEFEKEGYTLLSEEYINNKTKLNYICPKGHKGFISWNDWQSGNRCAECYKLNTYHTFEEVRFLFEKEGYTLLSTVYNVYDKLKYKCPYGHIHFVMLSNWLCGRRCPICANINNSAEKHWNWQGGKSFEKYCALWKDQEYKQDIRERDGNKCLNPYCNSGNSSDLTIHHIDYNKQNCNPYNLITVCRTCNSSANFDRVWHKAWYKAIMNKRYGIKTIGKTLEA